jgi:hypothetical protein
MKILDFFREIPKLFDWYFQLPQLKRIQLNYILLIALLFTISYYNDKQHRENYIVLSVRIDAVNNSRTKEQEKYTTKLEFYTDKFNHLLELLIQQKKEREQLKNEP